MPVWTPCKILTLIAAVLGSGLLATKVVAEPGVSSCLCTRTGAVGAGSSFCTRVRGEDHCTNLSGSPDYASLSEANRTTLNQFRCRGLGPAQFMRQTSPTDTSRLCPNNPYSDLQAAATALTAAPSPSAPEEPPERPFVSITPELGVPIPGLTFSPATREDGLISVPFLAQYISAIQRYLTGLALTAAVIMVVYGGFLYLLGSSLGEINHGKNIITDALIGLLLVLSAYAVLNIVNPNLTTLRPLALQTITPLTVERVQMTTREVTSEETYTESFANCPVPNLPPGHLDRPRGCGHTGRPACADHAVLQRNDPRAQAFEQNITRVVRAADPRQRILEVAEAASKCGVHMESCGHTAESIWRIAGVHPSTHHPFENSALVRQGMGALCQGCGTPQPGCTDNPEEARERMRGVVRAEQDARANMLQPGDWLWVYNANPSCGGNHSAIFMGWEGPYAKVVQGMWGSNVWAGRICLRTNCPGGRFSPITRIKRPAELR